MTDRVKEMDRVKMITHRLAFNNPKRDQNNSIDQLAFNSVWSSLVKYMTPAGAEILASVSVRLTDVEVGYIVLALIRAMSATRKGRLDMDGAKFLAQAVAHRAALTCSVTESALVEGLAKSEEDDCGADEQLLEQEVQTKTPRERTKLATTDGNIIDLTTIFKGR